MTGARRGKDFVNRSELVGRLALATPQLSRRELDLAVKTVVAHLSEALASGQQIELRGFGSFSLHYKSPRVGRNPKTGEPVALTGKYMPHFKPGKALREQVNRKHTPGGAQPSIGGRVAGRIVTCESQRERS